MGPLVRNGFEDWNVGDTTDILRIIPYFFSSKLEALDANILREPLRTKVALEM